MEQRIVLQGEEKYIYWIKDRDLAFYLTIPQNKKVSLILNMISEVNDEKVMGFTHLKDNVIITPVVGNDILNGVRENNALYFEKLDDIFSRIINLSHQILTYNHLEVESSIMLNDNKEYSMFNTWFVKKYQGRVVLTDSEVREGLTFIRPALSQELDQVQKPTVDNEELGMVESIGSNDETQSEKKDMGFVSYVLLGVLVAVISLVFLYYII